MVAPKPKSNTGISAVYTNTTGAIASVFSAFNNVAVAGEYLSKNTIVSAKTGLLDTYLEVLAKFNVDTSEMTPIQIREQAEAILDF
mgnify:FL=1